MTRVVHSGTCARAQGAAARLTRTKSLSSAVSPAHAGNDPSSSIRNLIAILIGISFCRWINSRVFTLPAIRIHVKVAIKADHPPARQPGERIAPEKNAILYEADDFLVFEEKLEPGDTRACHSHGERLVIQLNRARLQQWPDGEPARFVETVPERPAFSPPVIHTVRNIGETPLRGIVIEFKAQ
jgi:hypothetical protein